MLIGREIMLIMKVSTYRFMCTRKYIIICICRYSYYVPTFTHLCRNLLNLKTEIMYWEVSYLTNNDTYLPIHTCLYLHQPTYLFLQVHAAGRYPILPYISPHIAFERQFPSISIKLYLRIFPFSSRLPIFSDRASERPIFFSSVQN